MPYNLTEPKQANAFDGEAQVLKFMRVRNTPLFLLTHPDTHWECVSVRVIFIYQRDVFNNHAYLKGPQI